MSFILSNPKLLSNVLNREFHSIKDPDLGKAGVYVWRFKSERTKKIYYYVGRAKNLQSRLEQHRMLMNGETNFIGTSKKHIKVAQKYGKDAKVFVLENIESTEKSTLEGLERFWILYFWKTVGAESLLNLGYVPDGGDSSAALSARWKLSPERRQEQSVRMSAIMNAKFADPEYRAKNKAMVTARSSSPEARKAMSARSKEHFESKANRQKQSDNCSNQWKDPKFAELNLKRLERLRATGWNPTPATVVKVSLPSGDFFVIRQVDLVKTLGLGGRAEGQIDYLMRKSHFADWKFQVMGSLSGKVLLKRKPYLDSEFERFKSHPFVQWIVKAKAKNDKLFNINPVWFYVNGQRFRAIMKTIVYKGGQVQIDGAEQITAYETLWAFATDREATLVK